jgi:hypothetical protein
MNKLTKENRKELDLARDTLQQAEADVAAAVEEYNAALALAWTEVEVALEKLYEARGDASSVISSFVQQMEDYASERSERWQEGEAGQSYEAWKNSFEEITMDLEADPVEVPTPLDVGDWLEGYEAMSGLSDSPE